MEKTIKEIKLFEKMVRDQWAVTYKFFEEKGSKDNYVLRHLDDLSMLATYARYASELLEANEKNADRINNIDVFLGGKKIPILDVRESFEILKEYTRPYLEYFKTME